MSEKILWRSNSSRHDWRGGAPLLRLLTEAARLGLVGRAEHVEGRSRFDKVDIDIATLRSAQPGEALAKAILALPPTRKDIVEITVRGNDSVPWELFWNVYPMDADGTVDGLNTLWLTFDRSRARDSDALREAFFRACAIADTEYAMIHPYDHWSDFADAHYQDPVTINLQFKGVFWANFLGPGHLDQFDPAQLQELDAHEVRRIGEQGLFVLATPDLATADASDAEAVLLRLTEEFRQALRPDSKWHR
jgi:hypothetical protein